MKKNSTIGYIILGIMFVLTNIIAFSVPMIKSTSFWVSYVFTNVALAAQILIWNKNLGKNNSIKSKFLGLSIVHVGIVYVIFQMLALVVFLIVPTLDAWIAIVTSSIIAGVSAICMISADAGRDEIERVEAVVKKKVFYLQDLQTDIEVLYDAETDDDIKVALMQLIEKIRFSDPMSNEQLIDLENKISNKVSELKTTSQKMQIINELNLLLDERNRKCKIFK